jgi:hypothetical protein
MPVLNESASFLVSTIVSILLFSGMQMGKALLTSTPTFTIVGGFIGSILFVFLLTAISNFEKTLFGNNFQTKLAESVFCIVLAVSASASVHRVSASTCLIFSVAMLYYVNKISQKYYAAPVSSQPMAAEKAKKKK